MNLELIVFRFLLLYKIQNVGITFLRAPTHYGKLSWDRLFPSIVEKHPEADVSVVSSVLFFIFWVEIMVLRILFDLVLLWTSGSFKTDSSNVELTTN
jgi:hypothetical protein